MHNLEIENTQEIIASCKICNKPLKEIKTIGCGEYNTAAFIKHISSHNYSIEQYLLEFHQIDQPRCPYNNCDRRLKIACPNTKNFKWSKKCCGNNAGRVRWSEEAKVSRRGEGNPMFNQKPWNYGLNAETSESMQRISKKLTGRKADEESVRKMKIAQSKRTKEPHLGCKHSPETIAKLRANTLKMIKDGKYKHTNTLPFRKMIEFLECIGITYTKEVHLSHWSFDIYLNDLDVYIEVDGDYFHSNPKFWPEPSTKTQKKNFSRDISKNSYCNNNNIGLVRFWEDDIINNEEMVKCALRTLLVLKRLD